MTAVVAELTVRFDIVAIGAMTGLGYALLATGLVLVFRATGIINLAHGQIGAFAAVVFVELSGNVDLPYPVALLGAILAGAVIALVVERSLIRPLQGRSTVALLAATIGVIQVLLVLQLLLPAVIGAEYPLPVHVNWEINGLVVRGQHVTLLVFAPVALIAFGVFLERSRYGLAIRAVAANRSAARLAGIDADRVSTIVWSLAGSLAAIAAILTVPLTSITSGTAAPALGPSLLLRALAAGLVGRLTNLPLTVAAAIGIGVVEAILYSSFPADLGLVDAVLFVFILVLLVSRSATTPREGDSAALVEAPTPVPDAIRRTKTFARLRLSGYGSMLLAAFVLPVLYSSATDLFFLSRVAVFAIIGVSIVILTGWAGQLSLAQVAFAGVGAMGTAALNARGVPFGSAVFLTTGAGILLATVIGLPALRLRGLYLTVTTLGFAVAASSYFLTSDLFESGIGDTAVTTPGRLGPFDFNSYREGYYGCVTALTVVVAACVRLRSTGVGRTLFAVEGNDRSAAAMTVSPTAAKLTAFALAGGIATFAGGLLAGVSRTFRVELFTPEQSLQVLAMVIVGGLGSIMGAIVGAIYLLGVPAVLGDSNTAKLATSGIGLLVILRFQPGGLITFAYRIRDLVLDRFLPSANEADAEAQPDSERSDPPRGHRLASATDRGTPTPDRTSVPAEDGEAVPDPLALRSVCVELGGRTIVDKVDLRLQRDEIVGLIGANGAGKTTLLNAISGFLPSSGAIEFFGDDVTGHSPVERSRLGLGRSFQHARLYPRLTTRECVQVALEAQRRSEVVPSMLALPPSVRLERWSRKASDDVLDLLGLGLHAERRIDALSTGTRRVVELACLLAQRPRIVLLDEPMAGIAQRESEAFVPLLLDVRRTLDAPMIIIEHDMPMLIAVSDRLYCLEAGAVIASGVPEDVRNDPRVVASYLGTDERAIARSGQRTKGA